jgi:alpha/beta superfamily hydrolase
MARIDRLPPPVPNPIRSPAVTVAGEVEATLGTLEARVHVPASPRRAVLICHPHPLYGGSMHSPVPLSLAKTLSDQASDVVAWARFNFRGVGASAGTYAEGAGELDDALAVLARLGELAPGVPIATCGHSFGSWIAMRAACASPAVDRVLMIAPSTRFFDFPQAMAFATSSATWARAAPSPRSSARRSASSRASTTTSPSRAARWPRPRCPSSRRKSPGPERGMSEA